MTSIQGVRDLVPRLLSDYCGIQAGKGPGTVQNRSQDGSQEGPGWVPGGSQDGPGWVPDGSKQGQNRARQGQNRARTSSRTPGTLDSPDPGVPGPIQRLPWMALGQP